MNIIRYIEKYGNMSFYEKPLNEVDKLILSNLSYVDFDGIVAKNSFVKTKLELVGEKFFASNNDKGKKILAAKGGIRLLKSMYKTVRYKDLLLFNYEKIINSKQQFCALSIEIEKGLIYVSFEGTDEFVIGWKEDFEIAYKFPLVSQKSAINYLNKHFILRNCKLILGGHSKGGHLALISSMYANFAVRKKIIEIYSYDGPGILKEQLNSYRFKRIKDRFIHVIPNNSFVGLMLYSDNYRVIKTNSVGLLSHFALNWQVDDNDFMESVLNKSSVQLHENMNKWLEKYSSCDKERFVGEMFDILKKYNIESLIQIKSKPKLLMKLLNETSKLDDKTDVMFREIIKLIKKFLLKNVKEKVIKK